MNKCSCFLLFTIFALTNSTSKIKLKEKYRSYYPAAAATARINDKTKDTNNVDYRNNFVAKVKDGKKDTELVITAPEVETFTDFIQEAVDILNTYDNTAFKDFFHILDTEIRKYHYEGCRFSELMQNRNTRTLLAGALKSVRENTVTFTKANINEIADLMRNELYDRDVKELLDHIDSLYINTERDFHRILNNLKLHTKMKSRETHNDLEQVIRDGVRIVLFNHYTDLNTRIRRELKEKIEIFWEKYKKSTASNDEMNAIVNTDPNSKAAINNIITYIKDKIKEQERANSDSKNIVDQRKRIESKDTYDAQFQDNKTKERPFVSDKLATNVTEERTSSGEPKHNTINTNTIYNLHAESANKTKPILRAQEENKVEKRSNKVKLSKHLNRTEPSYRTQHKEWSRLRKEVQNALNELKPKLKPASEHKKIREIKHFNNFVNKKITTIDDELKKLKKVNDLRTRLIYFDPDEDNSYYDSMNEEFNDADEHITTISDKMKTNSNKKTDKRSDRNVPMMRADNKANVNENTTSQVLRNNINDTVTKKVTTNASSNDTTSTNSTVHSTSPQTVVTAVTVPTAGNNSTRHTTPDPNRIIRHKNPFEYINKKFGLVD